MTVSRRTVLMAGAAIPGLVSIPQLARAQAFSAEGRYDILPTPQPTANPDKVEVVEIFWYGCPHCNRFQPHIDPWQAKAPDYVDFVRMPAIFRKSWEVHARAYYASEAMGALEKTHAQMFAQIHGRGEKLDSRDAVEQFFAAQGIGDDAFSKSYDSFAVDSGIRRSKVMQERYGIRGVPSVIVNGKYRVTASLAGSYPNMIQVMNALIEREHKAMKTA